MKREAVADRIVTYSDALVAFSLVNGLAFLVALGEPDIRCSIAEIATMIFWINALVPVTATLLLIWLRGMERALRGPTDDELVDRFWTLMGRARFVLVWFFAGIVSVGIFAATRDPRCLLVGS